MFLFQFNGSEATKNIELFLDKPKYFPRQLLESKGYFYRLSNCYVGSAIPGTAKTGITGRVVTR